MQQECLTQVLQYQAVNPSRSASSEKFQQRWIIYGIDIQTDLPSKFLELPS